MDPIQSYLQNLRPGGASNIHKSKLDQTVTEDSELDSPTSKVPTDPVMDSVMDSVVEPVSNEGVKKPRKKIVKQTADVQQESSEFDEIAKDKSPIVEPEIVAKDVSQPLPLPRQSLSKSKQSDNEAIKIICRQLQIGNDGYLTLPELEKMCNYLEMNESDKKDIQDLFVVIDTDKDNRVLLSEFSIALKTHHKLLNGSDKPESKINTRKRPQNNSIKQSNAIIPVVNLPNGRRSNLFSILDPNETGFCDSEKIVEYWVSGGILNGHDVLEYLNFNVNGNVDLLELSSSLEKEIFASDTDAITLAGIITYQKELYHRRSMIDELLDRIMKLNKEISKIDFENSQLRNRLLEVQDINILQEEELDAVAELHRKMISNQTMSKTDRDELYELKKKFEQHFETPNKDAIQNNLNAINEERNNSSRLEAKLSMSERKVNELQRKLQLKFDEVNYLKKEIEVTNSHLKQKESEIISRQLKDLETTISAYKKKNEELKERNEMLSQKIQSLEGKVDIAINREKAYKMRLVSIEREGEKMVTLEENLRELNETLNDTTALHEEKLANYRKTIEELKRENKELKIYYHEMENQFKKIMEENLLDKETLRKKNRQIDNHKNEIADFNETLARYREDNRINKVIIDKLEIANDRLSKSINKTLTKLDEFPKQPFDSGAKNSLTENIKMHKENMLLEDEVSQLNRRLSEMELFQVKESNVEIQTLRRQIREKEKKLEELEEDLHRKNSDLRSDRFGSAKKIEQLQFKYEELDKKYQLQLEQVDKVDNLLKDLYEENTKLVRSLQRSDAANELNQMKIIQLEEKINTLQNILSRSS